MTRSAVHNVPVGGATVRRVGAGLLCALLALAALTACSDDGKGPDIPRGSTGASTTAASGSASAAPTAQVVDGVTLSAQGSKLTVGQTATVSYQPRQGQTGVLDITVTRLEKTSFKKSFVGWDIQPQDKKSSPFFVRATVTNRGTLDLGGRPVPLYIVDGHNTLVEATTFASTFRPCKPGHFPARFPTGATTNVCLVYLAPQAGGQEGALTAVSFRPVQKFDPITWTGPLLAPEPLTGKGRKKS